MKSAIVTRATERAGTRQLVGALANGLHAAGHMSALIWVSEEIGGSVAPPSVASGVDVLTLNTVSPGERWVPGFPLVRMTRQIAPRLSDFDVVFGFVSGHPT